MGVLGSNEPMTVLDRAWKFVLGLVLMDHDRRYTLAKEQFLMASDFGSIKAAAQKLKSTVDMTQENIHAVLLLLKGQPTPEQVEEVRAILEGTDTDLGSTNFDPAAEPDAAPEA